MVVSEEGLGSESQQICDDGLEGRAVCGDGQCWIGEGVRDDDAVIKTTELPFLGTLLASDMRGNEPLE